MYKVTVNLLVFMTLTSWTAGIAQTLTATPGAPQAMDGVIGDGEWTSEALVTNNAVTLYAMADGQFFYLAAHWADSTESIDKRRWQYDGATWTRGSEDEDRIAFIWDMGLNGSDGAQCLTMCHGDKMHTNIGFVDVWHWKAVRSNGVGYVDDKYWDTADRQNDPGRGASVDNNTEAGGPAYMALSDPGANVDFLAADADALAAFDPFGTMAAHTVAQAVPFDANAAFVAGNTIPWYLLRPSDGDRGSVHAAGKWEDGWWTVEFKKPYAGGPAGKAGSDFDFDVVPGTTTDFTHEIFDNTGDKHSLDGFDQTVYTLDLTGLVTTGAEPLAGELPTSFSLRQNYPNPFNPSTTIRYDLPEAADVRLAVFDALGRVVDDLGSRRLVPGSYTVTWDAGALPSGAYFVRMEAGGYVGFRRMVLVK